MPTVSFNQTGPDGSTVLNRIVMYVCPLCGSVIPVPPEGKETELAFPTWHENDHLAIARVEDEIERISKALDDLGNPAQVVAVPNVEEGPHSRACGISNHPHGPQCHSNCPTCHGRPYTVTERG